MRILALHGLHTNGMFLNKQSRNMQRILKDIEWIFPNSVNLSNVYNYNKYCVGPCYNWFEYDDKKYYNLDKSEEYIRSIGKFDGIMGFSQGASFGASIIDLVDPRFFISIAGSEPIKPIKKIHKPSFHLIGLKDNKKNKSIQLKEICKNPEVYYFTEGHQFPIKNAKFFYFRLNQFLKKFR